MYVCTHQMLQDCGQFVVQHLVQLVCGRDGATGPRVSVEGGKVHVGDLDGGERVVKLGLDFGGKVAGAENAAVKGSLE